MRRAMNSLVVMGVSGCGKSRVGALIAERLRLPLIEGDSYHSDYNRALMNSGTPLTDLDRSAWLDRLGAALALNPGGAVLSCSALKASHRHRLRAASPGLSFAWLDLDESSALSRVAKRPGHFFPANLVSTQFEILESPAQEARVMRLDALLPPEVLADRVAQWMLQETGAGLDVCRADS